MTPSPRRRVWRSRLLVVGLLVLVAGGLLTWALVGGRSAQRLQAELDRDEPGWRWDDIRRKYEAGLPPDADNPFGVAHAAATTVPKWYTDWLEKTHQEDRGNGWADVPVHRRPPADRVDELVRIRDRLAPTLAPARRLASTRGPSGHRYTYSVDVLGTLCQPMQDLRSLIAALRHDAVASALAGDADRAVESCRAGVGVARAIGDDPMPVAMYVRMAAAQAAVDGAERTLALTEPSAGLAELEAELRAEAEHPRLRTMFHSDRAVLDVFYDNFRTGKDSVPAMVARYGMAVPGSVRMQEFLFTFQREGEHFAQLEQGTRLARIADLPEHERRAAAGLLPPDPVGRSVVGRLYGGLAGGGPANAYVRQVDSDLRCTARLRAAAAGIGCERFRRKTGRWPDGLAEAVSPVPTDPFTGRPLLFLRVPGGAVVYSVGADGADDGGNVEPGPDVGFRLFDPDMRNRPADE